MIGSSEPTLNVPVARFEDLTDGQVHIVDLTGFPELAGFLADLDDPLRLLLVRLGDVVYAIEDRCTHDGGHLGEAPLEGCEVTCCRHGARFDVTTGRATRLPAVRPVTTFPVRIQDGMVEVDLTRA
jgi:3-phenylpropionate/trans-cinnamate dioxygenase ferredoxin subunit